MFGGNSNWRGPDLAAGQRAAHPRAAQLSPTTATSFKVECPTGSGTRMNLVRGRAGDSRAGWPASSCGTTQGAARCTAAPTKFQEDPHWRDLHALLRVLPRRQRRRHRRQPPDGLDRRSSRRAHAGSSTLDAEKLLEHGRRRSTRAERAPGVAAQRERDRCRATRRSTRSTRASWLHELGVALGRARDARRHPRRGARRSRRRRLRLGVAPRRVADRRGRARRSREPARTGSESTRSCCPTSPTDDVVRLAVRHPRLRACTATSAAPRRCARFRERWPSAGCG